MLIYQKLQIIVHQSTQFHTFYFIKTVPSSYLLLTVSYRTLNPHRLYYHNRGYHSDP